MKARARIIKERRTRLIPRPEVQFVVIPTKWTHGILACVLIVSALPAASAIPGQPPRRIDEQPPAMPCLIDLSDTSYCGPGSGFPRPRNDPDASWCDHGLQVYVEDVGEWTLVEQGPDPLPCWRVAVLAPDGMLVVQVDGVASLSIP
ncbi:MAG TPA: hypothetical protein VM681_01990 [Candidatus Thermoplasmatota archaeon]|nr:hypothetical protein [Candidatus Thermoplasmatota archaeon]